MYNSSMKNLAMRLSVATIALFLAALVWIGITNLTDKHSVRAAVRQTWEYKRLYIQQASWDNEKGAPIDSDTWYEDGVKHDGPLDMGKKLQELGAGGWELVNVMPVSNIWATKSNYYDQSPGGPGFKGVTIGVAMNGMTSQYNYYFKRPKM
jgi:hypothetical protein